MAGCITVRDYLLTLTWYLEYWLDHLSGLVYKRRQKDRLYHSLLRHKTSHRTVL